MKNVGKLVIEEWGEGNAYRRIVLRASLLTTDHSTQANFLAAGRADAGQDDLPAHDAAWVLYPLLAGQSGELRLGVADEADDRRRFRLSCAFRESNQRCGVSTSAALERLVRAATNDG